MKVYLFGGPGDGRSFDVYGNPYDVYFMEDVLPEKFDDYQVNMIKMPPRHTYSQINGSLMFAHDCRGQCNWADVPGHCISAGDHEQPLRYIEAYLRDWAYRTTFHD